MPPAMATEPVGATVSKPSGPYVISAVAPAPFHTRT